MVWQPFHYVFAFTDPTTYLRKYYCNINSRFGVTEDDWPPYHSKHYTTLAFVHHKKYENDKKYEKDTGDTKDKDHTDVVVISVTEELARKGDISKSPHVNSSTKATKSISDIFTFVTSTSKSKMVLIEGAPGIGKTVLSKEIAFQWANNKMLNSIKLLLLVFLRNLKNNLSSIKSVESFMEYTLKSRVANDIADYYLKSSGEDLAIVLDGYDEISEEDRTDSFVADIINRRVFSDCLLVITSRPTASLPLQRNVTCRVEVVGFTEEDRLDYIKAAIPDSQEKVEALQHYLKSNPTINALCYIPLNMAILLCLSDNGVENLPKTQTELHKKFIKMTITRHFQKQNHQDDNFVAANIDLFNLPHPHNKVFNELAHFAFKALKSDQLVFTLAELKKRCPILAKSPNYWNGLGLLQSVKYFDYTAGKGNVTYHFLHFSIQEYMAAYHISKLPSYEQIRLLEKQFWTIHYYNTWIMYVGITDGKSFAMKHFFSGNRFRLFTRLARNPGISRNIINDKIKCLHMFQCLAETNNSDMISSVAKCFGNQEIDLSNQTLLPSHLNTVCFFLIRSICKEWKRLNLSNCNIGDNGCDVLSEWSLNKNAHDLVSIKYVDISSNHFGFLSLIKFFETFRSWCTSEIIITDTAISDSTTSSKLYAAIENIFVQSKPTKIGTLQLAVIGSFLFAYQIKQVDILKMFFLQPYNLKSIYLLHISWPEKQNFQRRISKLESIHFLGRSMRNVAFSECIDISAVTSLFIYDHTLSEDEACAIYEIIKNIHISGVFLIVSKHKIQGVIDTCSLRNELSNLELLNLIGAMRSFCCNTFLSTMSWNENLQFYGNSSEAIIQSFVSVINPTHDLRICLVEGNTLIAHNVDYDTINKIKVPVINLYFNNCCLNTDEYINVITKFKEVSSLYIFNDQVLSYFDINKSLKEIFIHVETCDFHNLWGSFYDYDKNYNITLKKQCVSGVIITKDTIEVHNPTSKQLSLVLQLKSSARELYFNWCQLKPEIYYQVVSMLTSTPIKLTVSIMRFSQFVLKNVDCEILLEHILKGNSSVKKIYLFLTDISVSLNVMCKFVNILAAWNVEEVQIIVRVFKYHMQFYNYLIKKLEEKFFISVICPRYDYKQYSSTIKITKKL